MKHTISNDWFEVGFDDRGGLDRLTLPWMNDASELPVQMVESYGLILQDDKFFLPQDALKEAIEELIQRSPDVNELVRRTGLGGEIYGLTPASVEVRSGEHSLEYQTADVTISRVVRAHSVYPVPTIVHRATNRGARAIDLNYYWCVGTQGDRYGLLAEKGDMAPSMLEALGGECALYFIPMLRSLRVGHPLLGWAHVNLNFGTIQPGETKSFVINLWAVKHPWIGTQFGGYGFILGDHNPVAAVAATAAVAGRNLESAAWLLGRLYAPVFIVDGTALPEQLNSVLSRTPLRLLITNVQLDAASQALCKQKHITIVYAADRDPDPFVAIQLALDEALGTSGSKVPTIVNVLPAGIDRQLLLSYYYGLRRDTADIGNRFTVPVRNVFVQAASLPDERYAALLRGSSIIRLLGSENELSSELEKWLSQLSRTSRHRFEGPEQPLPTVLSFFGTHDYALARMAVEALVDPRNSPVETFSAAIEKETGHRDFWGVSPELILKHGKPEIFGPPFSVIVPTSQWGSDALFNAVQGVQYAKALRACLFPFHYLPEERQSVVRRAFEALRNQVSRLGASNEGWPQVEDNLKVISSELISCFDGITKILLQAEKFSVKVRAGFGRRGIYSFHGDHSLPIELVSRYERFGRQDTLGTSILFGRMAFESPDQTAFYCAETVLFQQTVSEADVDVVLASDPTGDLPGSFLEQANALRALGRGGFNARLLMGLDKRTLSPDGKVKNWSMASSGPFRVIESRPEDDTEAGSEIVYEFETPRNCTVGNFVEAISSAAGLHFIGHGEVRGTSHELALADGNLSFREFPRLRGHPWLLLNACEIGLGGRQDESAMQLIHKGAVQVIAPLLAIKDAYVSDMGFLYGELLFMSMPAAFHVSRHDLFLTRRSSTDHLAYVLYGDPFACQGRKSWEIYEAFHCGRDGWQQSVATQKCNLYERSIYLWRLLESEATQGALAGTSVYQGELIEFFAERAAATAGALYSLRARLLPSGRERFEFLTEAAEAYLSAAGMRRRHLFNQALMQASANWESTGMRVESAALSFLRELPDVERLRSEFEHAIARLRDTGTTFRQIEAVETAEACDSMREKLERVVRLIPHEVGEPGFQSALEALLYVPESYFTA